MGQGQWPSRRGAELAERRPAPSTLARAGPRRPGCLFPTHGATARRRRQAMMRFLGFLGLAAAFFGLSAWFVIRALPGPPAAETVPASAVPAAVAEATPEQVHA